MLKDKDFGELVDTYIDQNKMYNMEGSIGVRNLNKLVTALGYDSRFNVSTLHAFLEDNSACIEAMIEWIKGWPGSPEEWKEALCEQMADKEEPDDAE